MYTKTDTKIDQIVDEFVVDDVIATQLKSKLHEQIEPKPDEITQAQAQDDDDAGDDFWDNIPV
ncbi:hypothetical protein [Pacificibacter marinus]|uniref:hypothetical protein n=1 Tax=Pacificibacter marinus TaxID=658057 RepID=UPI001C07E3D6|nr:hypothetical protein [Pacificibacter marinus]MBU2867185.1 hypothetical protein [Pacificibacter marinus]